MVVVLLALLKIVIKDDSNPQVRISNLVFSVII